MGIYNTATYSKRRCSMNRVFMASRTPHGTGGKSVPASAFRAGRPKRRRPTLAAKFSGSFSERKESSSSAIEKKTAHYETRPSVDVASTIASSATGLCHTTPDVIQVSVGPTARGDSRLERGADVAAIVGLNPPQCSDNSDHRQHIIDVGDKRVGRASGPWEGMDGAEVNSVLSSPVLTAPLSSVGVSTEVAQASQQSFSESVNYISVAMDTESTDHRNDKVSISSQLNSSSANHPITLCFQENTSASGKTQTLEHVNLSPHDISGFPFSAFKISPISGILERCLPYQSHRYITSHSPRACNTELSPVSEGIGSVVDLELVKMEELDKVTNEDEKKVEEKKNETETGAGEDITSIESGEDEMGDEDEGANSSIIANKDTSGAHSDDSYHTSLLAMDVEGLLMERTSSAAKIDTGIVVSKTHRDSYRKRVQRNKNSKLCDSIAEDASEVAVKTKKYASRARRSRREKGRDYLDGSTASLSEKEPKKPKRPRPNAFVAVRVFSEDIRSGLDAVQKGMVRKQPDIKSTLTSLDKLHLTLSVFRMEKGDEERGRAALFAATQKSATDLGFCDNPLTLQFSGLSSFGKRVVFSSVEKGEPLERLCAMADIVRSVFKEHGLIDVDGMKPFSPHLTIAKMSAFRGWGKRGAQKKKKFSGISNEHYANFKDTLFGAQTIVGLELLSMTEPQDIGGYYLCFQKFSFDEFAPKLRVKELVLDEPPPDK